MTLVNFTDDDLATLRHQLFKTQQQVDNLQAHIASITPTGGPARAVIVGVASGEIPAASGQTYGKGDMKVYPLYADGRARVDTREQEVYNPSATAIDDGEKVVAWKETWGRLWIVRPVESEEWTVAELEAETAIEHDAAVTYDTAAGDFQIEAADDVNIIPANNFFVNAGDDVDIQAGGNSYLYIDQGDDTILVGGALLIDRPNAKIQLIAGVKGIPVLRQQQVGFADFQDAAQNKTITLTAIDWNDGDWILGGNYNVTTLFDDAGSNDFTLEMGHDDGPDTTALRSANNVDVTSGTTGRYSIHNSEESGGSLTHLPQLNDSGNSRNITATMRTTGAASLNTLTQGVVTFNLVVLEE